VTLPFFQRYAAPTQDRSGIHDRGILQNNNCVLLQEKKKEEHAGAGAQGEKKKEHAGCEKAEEKKEEHNGGLLQLTRHSSGLLQELKQYYQFHHTAGLVQIIPTVPLQRLPHLQAHHAGL